jgi:hypothetical protein
MKALAKNPDERYKSARELYRNLPRFHRQRSRFAPFRDA